MGRQGGGHHAEMAFFRDHSDARFLGLRQCFNSSNFDRYPGFWIPEPRQLSMGAARFAATCFDSTISE